MQHCPIVPLFLFFGQVLALWWRLEKVNFKSARTSQCPIKLVDARPFRRYEYPQISSRNPNGVRHHRIHEGAVVWLIHFLMKKPAGLPPTRVSSCPDRAAKVRELSKLHIAKSSTTFWLCMPPKTLSPRPKCTYWISTSPPLKAPSNTRKEYIRKPCTADPLTTDSVQMKHLLRG